MGTSVGTNKNEKLSRLVNLLISNSNDINDSDTDSCSDLLEKGRRPPIKYNRIRTKN